MMSPHCGHRTTTFQMYAFFSHYYRRKREHNKSRMISGHCIRWFFFLQEHESFVRAILHLISFSHYPSCVIGFSRYVNSFSLISFLPSRRQSEFRSSLRLPNVDSLTVFLCYLLIFAPRRKAKSRGGTLVTRAYLQLKYTVIQSI